jgi:glycosyltransferase involved in cell wall biosynthesis
LGAAADRTLTIPNGVSPAIGQTDPNAGSDVRRSLGMGDPNPVVVGLGRFVFKKGFEYLLDAWPLVVRDWPNARLVLGGDGHLFSSFEDRIRSLGVADTVRLPGRIPSDAVPRYLAAADVFVAPSIYDQSGNVDGMPVVVLEAMAAGKPIVATRVGGLAEVVQHGVNGLLVDERSPRAIADAIAMLLADPELRASYGARARDRVVEQFTWTTIARRFAELYREAGKRHECASFASFD